MSRNRKKPEPHSQQFDRLSRILGQIQAHGGGPAPKLAWEQLEFPFGRNA